MVRFILRSGLSFISALRSSFCVSGLMRYVHVLIGMSFNAMRMEHKWRMPGAAVMFFDFVA